MQNLKILIVEDDILIANDVKQLLSDWGYTVVGCADNFDDALSLFEQSQPDIALVDVQIVGEKDGVHTATAFNLLRRIPIIFLTAQADFQTVTRAKNAEPSAYLLKPFDERHLHISLDLAISNFYKENNESENLAKQSEAKTANEVKLGADCFLRKDNYVFIKQNYRFVKIFLTDILYLEADGNHCKIVLKTQKILVRLSLTNVLERLNEIDKMIRVHRSFAININCVDEFDDSEILINSKSIPLAPIYKDAFLERFLVNN